MHETQDMAKRNGRNINALAHARAMSLLSDKSKAQAKATYPKVDAWETPLARSHVWSSSSLFLSLSHSPPPFSPLPSPLSPLPILSLSLSLSF